MNKIDTKGFFKGLNPYFPPGSCVYGEMVKLLDFNLVMTGDWTARSEDEIKEIKEQIKDNDVFYLVLSHGNNYCLLLSRRGNEMAKDIFTISFFEKPETNEF